MSGGVVGFGSLGGSVGFAELGGLGFVGSMGPGGRDWILILVTLAGLGVSEEYITGGKTLEKTGGARLEVLEGSEETTGGTTGEGTTGEGSGEPTEEGSGEARLSNSPERPDQDR